MSYTAASLEALAGGHHEMMVALRRDLHAHPELAFQEHRTARLAAERLEAMGLEVRTGVGQTGVVALLHGAHRGRVLMLRADTDALPIHEQHEAPYATVDAARELDFTHHHARFDFDERARRGHTRARRRRSALFVTG